MRVFVTGATGFIGRVTIEELLKHGHKVVGLARNDANAEALSNAGVECHRGNLEDLESLRSGAKASEGVIHLGFVHDFSNFARAVAIDNAAVEAMLEVMTGTGKPFVLASGTMGTPSGILCTEDTEPERGTPFSGRAISADLVYEMSRETNIRGSVIRLCPTVHGEGDKGMIPRFIDVFSKSGNVVYVGEGSARWPAVHRLDAAVLFRLALEKGTAGATYMAVAEQGIPTKDFMTVIGNRLQLPVEGKPLEKVVEAMGVLGYVIARDNPCSSEKTQKELEWHPTQVGLLEDMEAHYFS